MTKSGTSRSSIVRRYRSVIGAAGRFAFRMMDVLFQLAAGVKIFPPTGRLRVKQPQRRQSTRGWLQRRGGEGFHRAGAEAEADLAGGKRVVLPVDDELVVPIELEIVAA